MFKVEKITPEPTVTLTTTLYGAEFIQRCLKFYIDNNTGISAMATTSSAAKRLIDAINCPNFDYDSSLVNKLFR